MTLEDLIRRFRALARDTIEPYRWSDENVTDWLNDAQEQACVRGRLIADDSTPEVCRIELEPGKRGYKLHKAVHEIISLRHVSAIEVVSWRVHLVSREWLDAEMPRWRDEEPSRAAYAIQDDTSIRIVGSIDVGDALHLDCYRLPLSKLENDMDEPEIASAHHEYLIHWALHKAYSVPDSEGFDANRSSQSEREFSAYFGPRPSSNLRRNSRHDVQHYIRGVLP